MSFDALSGNLSITTQWNAQKAVAGYSNPNMNQNSDGKSVAWSKVGTAAGQASILTAGILSIAPSGLASIDLTNIVDILGGTGGTLATAGLKGFKFQLLSTTDDPVNGTNCSQVTIGNSGTNDHPRNLGAGTMTQILKNGEPVGWATNQATGRAVSATAKIIQFANNDAAIAAKIRYVIWG